MKASMKASWIDPTAPSYRARKYFCLARTTNNIGSMSNRIGSGDYKAYLGAALCHGSGFGVCGAETRANCANFKRSSAWSALCRSANINRSPNSLIRCWTSQRFLKHRGQHNSGGQNSLAELLGAIITRVWWLPSVLGREAEEEGERE